MIKNLLWVGIGGGVGSIARYLVQRWVNSLYVYSFPLATFLVNIAGCLLIGILYALAEKTNVLTPATRLLLITGLCGGFTTFSTFAFENTDLMRTGNHLVFALYAGGSVLVGILAVFIGSAIIK
ncbi:MAG: fluoride efflux transporter CrcB [Flavisolibacter sp.]